jgi:hypothetical protein
MDVSEEDIGEWNDNHPLNKQDTFEKEFMRLFPLSSTNIKHKMCET